MVGGERAQVDLLLPPGAEPHEWEPKPGELAKIYNADIFIFIGRAMEPWAYDLLKATQKPNLKIVEAMKGLRLLEAGESPREISRDHKPRTEEKVDPHVWLDFPQDLKIIEAISAAFAEKDPAHASQYRANAASYQSQLAGLDQKYQAALARCRFRQITRFGFPFVGFGPRGQEEVYLGPLSSDHPGEFLQGEKGGYRLDLRLGLGIGIDPG